MATKQDFVEHVQSQSGLGQQLSFRKMFGEYALYLQGKVVALACDNQLYVKLTTQGSALLSGDVTAHPPYPGAKPHLLIDEQIEDRDLLGRLLQVTADALPVPKPKPTKKKAQTSKDGAGSKAPVKRSDKSHGG